MPHRHVLGHVECDRTLSTLVSDMARSVGRSEQLATLETAYAAVSAGQGQLVLIYGEPGAGKSTLVTQFSRRLAPDRDLLVGYCDPLSTPRPAGPLVDIAARLGGPLVEMLAAGQRRGLFDATLNAISTGPRPPVIVFEDVHWADELTLELLGFLARRIASVPVLLVVTYRDDQISAEHPTRAWLGSLATNPTVTYVAVPPLTVEQVTALAEGSDLDPGEVHARTGGNAFYVSEVLCAPHTAVPARVADAIVARGASLSKPARRALLAAAVIGQRVEPNVLLAVRDIDSEAVEACVTAGLLSYVAPVFQFRHELTRQAILAEASGFSITAMHAEVLRALRSIDPNALARLAEHAERAGDAAAVLDLAPRAARRAACLGAHRQASAQYRRALAFAAGTSDEVRAELLTALSFELFLTASLSESLEARRSAFDLRDQARQPAAAADDLRWMSRISWYGGNRTEAENYARLSCELLAPVPSPELAMAQSNQSQLLMLAGRYNEAIETGELALEIADQADDLETRVHALNNIGTAKVRLGLPEGGKLIEESLRLALENDLEDHAARAYVNLADGIEQHGPGDDGHYLYEGLAYCAARELDLQWRYLEATRAMVLLRGGEWAEAEHVARDLLDLAAIPVHRFVALLPLVLLAIRRGEPHAELLTEASAIADRLGEPQRLLPIAFARAEAAWLAGSPSDMAGELTAFRAMTEAREDAWRTAELHYWLTGAIPTHVARANLIGPYAIQLTAAPRNAAAAWTDLNSPYEAAIALLDGDEFDVREALTVFQRLGAEPAARLARCRLRNLGAAVIPRGPRRSTAEHPFGLTSREEEVLRLLTEDLTNQEIASRLVVSERTVHHHVSALLAKLQVRSRTAAAALARRRGLETVGAHTRYPG
jgi:DNA-binding CsgD family transcriptional regulator/energy-coupling factor transporter ATP-binding protein EcfA2